MGMTTFASFVLLVAFAFGPLLARQTLSLARAATAPKPELSPLGGELWKNLQQTALGVMLLLDQALLAVDGVLRTLYRLIVSKRHLLEWTTMSQAARSQRRGRVRASRRFATSAWLAFFIGAAVVGFSAASMPVALPLLGLWLIGRRDA